MAKEKINFMQMIVARKNKNTDNRGDNASREFDTTDSVRLLSWDEMADRTNEKRRKSNTDFALCNFAWQNSSYTAENDKFTGVYWSLSAYDENYVRCVNIDGSRYARYVILSSLGSVPALSLNLQSLIAARSASASEIFETKKTKSGKEKHFLKIGEYPKTKATDEIQQALEEMFNGGILKSGLTCTGRLFTTNGQRESGKDFLSKQNPEFELNGKKYVRTIVWNDNDRKFADGSAVPRTGAVVWLEVEPVTFEITNWDRLPKSINPKGKRFGADETIELEAEEAILSGLPFYPDWHHSNCSMWQNSLQRCFLSSAKSEELDGNPEFETPYKWDFSKSGFLYQALDLTREPTREYVIPEYEKEIADYAFAGCVGIEKIIVHDGVKKVGANAFSGLQNTQLEFICGAKGISIDKKAFAGSAFKYIYLSKDGTKLTMTTSVDPELEKSCVRESISTLETERMSGAFDATINFGQIAGQGLKPVSKWFENNFRQNYVQLKVWREEKKIKFIPPEYTMEVFPSSQMEKYFVNNNSGRWGKLVKTLGFDTLEGTEKNNSLVDLMKIYYAIGGFSENQGESEKAFEYILQYVAKGKAIIGREGYAYVKNPTPSQIGAEIHARFSKLTLKGEYNKAFAQFFMKYYKDNPDFMNFRLRDKDGDLMDSQDYLCAAHNAFESILKNYPNRVVNGNEERALLSPRFVAEHSSFVEYEGVEEGNEILAELLGRYGYDQEQFDHIQEVYETAKKLKDTYIIRADKAKESNPVQFRVLEKDDPLGFVLGDITNCCQVLGGDGETCVDDGYTNPNAGFLVFEESILDENGKPTGETRVLGQAYIWYDPQTKTVCYDNIEIPTKVLDEMRKGNKHEDSRVTSKTLMDAVEESAVAIMTAMNKDGMKVERVTTGEGYNDLKRELSEKFERESSPKAQHRGYSGYSDARSAQYIIKTYDEVTRMYGDEIRQAAKEARKDIQEIREKRAESQQTL